MGCVPKRTLMIKTRFLGVGDLPLSTTNPPRPSVCERSQTFWFGVSITHSIQGVLLWYIVLISFLGKSSACLLYFCLSDLLCFPRMATSRRKGVNLYVGGECSGSSIVRVEGWKLFPPNKYLGIVCVIQKANILCGCSACRFTEVTHGEETF